MRRDRGEARGEGGRGGFEAAEGLQCSLGSGGGAGGTDLWRGVGEQIDLLLHRGDAEGGVRFLDLCIRVVLDTEGSDEAPLLEGGVLAQASEGRRPHLRPRKVGSPSLICKVAQGPRTACDATTTRGAYLQCNAFRKVPTLPHLHPREGGAMPSTHP